MKFFKHATAEVSEKALVGKDTKIWNYAQIREGAQIGDNCIIAKNVFIDFDVKIGNKVKIQNNVSVYNGVTIKDGVFVGPHVCFTNDKNPRSINADGSLKNNNDWKISEILVKEGASLGANSTLLPGVTIGKHAMIGAGAVITKDIPDYAIAYGNPARIQGDVRNYDQNKNIKCNKKTLLVITPSFTGGSWTIIRKKIHALNNTSNFNIIVLGLGNAQEVTNDGFKSFSIPYPRYDKWGIITVKSPLINLLWNLPLFFPAFYLVFTKRPNMIMTNGFTIAIPLAPLKKIFHFKLVVSFHGIIKDYVGEKQNKFIRKLSPLIDLVIVNSKGSFDDTSSIIDNKEKLFINEHFAEDIFFKEPINKQSNNYLTIFYVGRLDQDKICLPLIQLAESLKNDKRFQFKFAGVGQYEHKVISLAKQSSQIKYLGYITDRKKLLKFYANSDIVWSYADETYLAVPAVESLATGTPIIIPKYAALPNKFLKKIPIQKDLVPKEIGWLVDPDNQESLVKLFVNIKEKGINMKMRKACRDCAKEKYSNRNITKTSKRILSLLKEKL